MKPQPSPTTITIAPSLGTPPLEKEKEMLEVKANNYLKKTISIGAVKSISFDICNPFIIEYQRVTELTYEKLQELSHIIHSRRKSLFARLTTCIGSNPELIYQFY